MSLSKFKKPSLKDKINNLELERLAKELREDTKETKLGKVEPKKKNKK